MDSTDEPKSKKARKRVKIKCLDCGSVFDDDYLTRHEKTKHDGKKVKTKIEGVPENQNPFELAKRYASKKSEVPTYIYLYEIDFFTL